MVILEGSQVNHALENEYAPGTDDCYAMQVMFASSSYNYHHLFLYKVINNINNFKKLILKLSMVKALG